MGVMPITDSMFLLGESREHPMHVGGLQLYDVPKGAGGDFVGELHRDLLTMVDLKPLFRRRPAGPVNTVGQFAWSRDDQFDVEYHVRLSALAKPGRVRELLELVSRMHGSLLDRHRPLWEFHLIEGLQDNRFATYTKIHHSLVDGVAALRLLSKSLSEDVDERGLVPPWVVRPRDQTRAPRAGGGGNDLAGNLRAVAGALREVVGMGPAAIKVANEFFREQAATSPFQAPRSMLNVPITGARRFAAQGWPIERLKAVGAASGGTLNDVMLAMCAGALRRYLQDFDALPDKPLVAAVPMSLRSSDAADSGGNAVGAILTTLATDLADPADRLAAITASTARAKQLNAQLTQTQILALSAVLTAPVILAAIPGLGNLTPPPFNLLISNVPGPRNPLYWNGAKLVGQYPLSIPLDGQALNITVVSYAGSLEFGLTGCRRSVPHLQRMLGYLDQSLGELEKATG